MSDKPQRTERDLHELFSVLREHVVEVIGDFEEKLERRLQRLDERPPEVPPSPRSVLTQLAVQVVNLLTGLIGPPKDEKDDEP